MSTFISGNLSFRSWPLPDVRSVRFRAIHQVGEVAGGDDCVDVPESSPRNGFAAVTRLPAHAGAEWNASS